MIIIGSAARSEHGFRGAVGRLRFNRDIVNTDGGFSFTPTVAEHQPLPGEKAWQDTGLPIGRLQSTHESRMLAVLLDASNCCHQE